MTDDIAFDKFMGALICGEYALGYSMGWDEGTGGASSMGRRAINNPFNRKVYPVEHRAYNAGYHDGIEFMVELVKPFKRRF